MVRVSFDFVNFRPFLFLFFFIFILRYKTLHVLQANKQQRLLRLFKTVLLFFFQTCTSIAMAAKKIIVVVGATGRQGGGVANTFLGLSNWHVRAMTRNPSSETAQALSTKGEKIQRETISCAADQC